MKHELVTISFPVRTEPKWIDWPDGKKLPKYGEWRDAGELGEWMLIEWKREWNGSEQIRVHIRPRTEEFVS
jgi:hypothetical protein